ncbi:hypothetical protein Lsed01_00863 [Demequina sediminis]|uniref:Type IV secretion system protein n=1 Tax=Demequina sediminis TaxID=1930058 RepID=A0ABP9WF24_9MICO|nr:type IV secretion system protein [Demequina sediminis]BDZ62483.1 hypothetical protein GCM10025873_22740 [Demequina sediminis]
MTSSLALTGTDSFVARVVTPASDGKPLKRSQHSHARYISGRGGSRRWYQRVLAAVLNVVIFLGVVAGTAVATERQAQANWLTEGIRSIFCSTPAYNNSPSQGSVSSLITNDKDAAAFLEVPRTAEEILSSGVNWTVYNGEEDPSKNGSNRVDAKSADEDKRVDMFENGECVPVTSIVMTYTANSVMGGVKVLTSISGFVLEQAYHPTWVQGLIDTAGRAITGVDPETGAKVGDGLKDSLYLEFINLIIFFAALWFFWTGVVKRKTTEAASGAVWMLASVIGGSLLVYNPTLVPTITSDVTSSFADVILTGTAGKVMDVSGNDVDICALPGKEDEVITRQITCSMWSTAVLQPWVMGQYGTSLDELNGQAPDDIRIGDENVNNLALYQLSAQSLTPADRGAGSAVLDSKNNMFFATVDEVASPEASVPTSLTTWSGEASEQRVSIATVALIVSVMMSLLVIILAGTMLVAQIAVAILVFVSPFFLLLGVHPGMGRRLMARWGEMLVNALLKQILACVLLAMLLAFYAAILPNASSNWGTSVLAVIGISVATLIYRKELTKAVTSSVNFGSGGILSDQPASKAGAVMGGIAGGAVVGLGAGALSGGKVGAGIMKSGTGSVTQRAIAAGKATVAGAGRGAVKTAARAGVAQSSTGGAALVMSGQHGQVAGRQSAGKVESKFNEKQAHQQERDARQQEQAQAVEHQRAMADWKKNMSPNHQRYMKEWEKNRQNPEWRRAVTERYGLSEVPNPFEQSFNGYGKPKSEWKAGDAPARLHGADKAIDSTRVAPPAVGEQREAWLTGGNTPQAGSKSAGAPTERPSNSPQNAPQRPVNNPALTGKGGTGSAPQNGGNAGGSEAGRKQRGNPVKPPQGGLPQPQMNKGEQVKPQAQRKPSGGGQLPRPGQ